LTAAKEAIHEIRYQASRHPLRHERLAAFEFKVEPVVDVMDAVEVELKAIEYRKKNAS
jgi:hypothetical protein